MRASSGPRRARQQPPPPRSSAPSQSADRGSAAAATVLLVLGAEGASSRGPSELDRPLRRRGDSSRVSSAAVSLQASSSGSVFASAVRKKKRRRSGGGGAGTSGTQLASGWVAAVSRKSGKTYYRNIRTGHAQWRHPSAPTTGQAQAAFRRQQRDKQATVARKLPPPPKSPQPSQPSQLQFQGDTLVPIRAERRPSTVGAHAFGAFSILDEICGLDAFRAAPVDAAEQD